MSETSSPEPSGLVDRVHFRRGTGLVPAVVQSSTDGRVLMLAYMDREALERTLETGRVTFWSRSREAVWVKGETSGNWLETLEVRSDCDGDALLVRARPHGPACHTGRGSCFDAGAVAEVEGAAAGAPPSDRGPRPGRADEAVEPAPRTPAGSPSLEAAAPSPAPLLASVLQELVRVVEARHRDEPEGSYTVRLLSRGPEGAARKVEEEARETAGAAAGGDPRRLAEESADLLYHLVVLWRAAGLHPDTVGRVLAERRDGGG